VYGYYPPANSYLLPSTDITPAGSGYQSQMMAAGGPLLSNSPTYPIDQYSGAPAPGGDGFFGQASPAASFHSLTTSSTADSAGAGYPSFLSSAGYAFPAPPSVSVKQESSSPVDSGTSSAASTTERSTPSASAPAGSSALLQYSSSVNNNNDVVGPAYGDYSNALYASLQTGRLAAKQETRSSSPVNEYDDARHMMNFYSNAAAAAAAGRQDFSAYSPPLNAAATAHVQLM